MKNRHLVALGAYALALTLPAAALADGPPPDKHPEMKHGKPDGKPGEHPGKAEDGKSDKGPHGDRDQRPESDRKPELGDGRPGHGEGFRGAMRQLREDLKAGKVKKGELKDRLAKLHETAGERGKEHRQELAKRWGGSLALPSAREELKHHARRMAFLNRALVLAETEAKDKDKLTDRISKLIDKENERHERAMERFKSMPTPPVPSSAGTAVAVPAAASSAEGAAK